MSVHFSVLGPLRGWRGPAELELGPNQQRGILACLLIRPNQLVSVSDLTELLWEADPPASAVNVIHKYIGAIRRLLEPDLAARASGRWLSRHGAAYRLTTDEHSSDLLAFRRLVREGRSAQAQGRPGDALGLLLEALALRRGPCGGSLELSGPGRSYFTTVDQEYVAAVAEAADAALASAQPPRLLPLLKQVAASEPLNESVQARLMLTLAAAGQQALALEHYLQVRERLGVELGVDPGVELRAAHAKVLRQEIPAAVDADPAAVDADLAAVRAAPAAVGGPAAWSAARSGSAARSEPGAPAPLIPHPRAAPESGAPSGLSPVVPPAQLPVDLATFAGREWELSQVSQTLGSDGAGRTVAICAIDGMAGIGKTTFAVHWAHQVARHFEDGQVYLDLRGFHSSDAATAPAAALWTLLCSLGVPPGRIPDDLDARAGLYRSVLASKRVLLVLDNARDVRQVRPLVPGSPGCLVIVTSRSPLTGLAMTDGARQLRLGLPTPPAARELLERRLGAARVAAEPEATGEIIRRCGRLPLALAIVASRAAGPGFTLAWIAAELRRTQGRLDAFDAPGMTADARAVFSWSYRHLSPPAGRLFRLLALPEQAADITAADGAGLLGVPGDEAGRLIAELTGTGLLVEARPGRNSCHELIRAYAGELLASTGTAAKSAPIT